MENMIPNVDAMDMNKLDSDSRRKFLKLALSGATSMLLVHVPGAVALHGRGKGWKQMSTEHHYAYVIDVNKCIGWGGCVRACKSENNVPDGVFRTWVERYVITEDGGVYVDSPNGALKGFPPLSKEIKAKAVRSFFVPKMCNHCENPPCVQVCPVGATFKSPEGFVLIDHDHCIGCAYCVQACPYGARFINPVIKKSDKCTWCYHRVKNGKLPACVEACPTGARRFGDLLDPESAVSKVFNGHKWGVLKPDMFTSPTCFYVSLPQEVV
ncbi:MAG: 4Fe-4S dicluster domain-containing protein [Gammaproteobacteria bacterium]